MATLPDEIINTVLELQKQLLSIIDKTTATAFILLERYGENETTIVSLNDLDSIRLRSCTSFKIGL